MVEMSFRPVVRAFRQGSRRFGAWALEGGVRMASAFAPTLAVPPQEPRSIFVLRNNDIGDLLAVTPLFAALRQRFPGAWIAAGVGSWNLEVLLHNPHLSEVLAVNAPWFNKYQGAQGTLRRLAYLRSPEVRELARRRFEIGIDVLGSAWGSLLLLRAGIPYRLGVQGYAGGHSAAQATVVFDPRASVGRSALRFAELLGATDLPACRPQIFLTAEEKESAERWWAAVETDSGRKRRVVMGPGGGLAAKCWPGESFAALAARLPEVGDVAILVLGGPREGELVARVAAAANRARAFLSAPSLRETFALVAACDLVVCNSSMLLHTAAAFAKPSVVLLGRSFSSASQHQAQWGYSGLSRSLGKELPERTALATPEEALATVREAMPV
jgi:ADP-heptose:LPS heptosyltransferase